MTYRGGADDGITPEARAAAGHARRRAEDEMPAADTLAVLAAAAAKEDADMSPAEIRRLAAAAISQSQQIAYLLGRLAGLLDDSPEAGR